MYFTNIIKSVLNLAVLKYGNGGSIISDEELAKSNAIFPVIESLINSNTVEETVTLDFDLKYNDIVNFDTCDNEMDSASECESDINYKETVNGQNFSLRNMEDIVRFYDSRKKNKLRQTTNRYPKINNCAYIARFRKYISNKGTWKYKYNTIKMSVLKKFVNARKNGLPVHDSDLCRWATAKSKEIGFLQFKCSDYFIKSLKKKFKIVSRKVVKYVTCSQHENLELIENNAVEFVLSVRDLISTGYTAEQIFNADQSGFNYCVGNNRTLSHKGEKTTVCTAISNFGRTHSYTIMPTISLNGELPGKMLLCLREKDGKFGPSVSKGLFKTENLYVTCTTSGKMQKSTMKEWVNNCLLPILNASPSLVLLDCWTGSTDSSTYVALPQNCTKLQIPSNTTALIQPLDIYFFRQYKIFIKNITNRIAIDELKINITHRNEIIKMHCLVYNQLQSETYRPMLQYAWYKSNYTDKNPGIFQSVNQLSFHIPPDRYCDANECEESPFIKCSHCDNYLCFKHFYIMFHYHN